MNANVSLNLQRGYTAKDIAFIESTRPEGGGWRLFEYHDDIPKVTWAKVGQDGQMIVKTLMPVDDLFERTQTARAESAGKPWGDGQKVASIPIHIWQRELAEAQREGDEKHVKKWLNDPDHAKFRTKEGKV